MRMSNSWIISVTSSLLLGFATMGTEAGTGLYTGPYFPSPQAMNITIHQNTVAYLPCMVRQLGDKSVSWVRQRDADILTVDRYTFVRDERLTVHYIPDTGTWTLVIKYVQARDAGTYECQISTEPKMSKLVHLNVIVPQVEITGAVDKYVRKGSTARLECTVSSTVQLPDYIFWYRSGQRLLEYDHPRVRIALVRNGVQGREKSVTSSLVITDAKDVDGGNYTCLPSNLNGATTILHVLNDEHPAAMQTGAAMLTDPPSPLGILFVVLVAFILVHAHQDFSIYSHRRAAAACPQTTEAPQYKVVLISKPLKFPLKKQMGSTIGEDACVGYETGCLRLPGKWRLRRDLARQVSDTGTLSSKNVSMRGFDKIWESSSQVYVVL